MYKDILLRNERERQLIINEPERMWKNNFKIDSMTRHFETKLRKHEKNK